MKNFYSIAILLVLLISAQAQARSIFGNWQSRKQLHSPYQEYTYNLRQSLSLSKNHIELRVKCSVEGNAGSTTVSSESTTQIEAQSDGRTFYLYNINFQGERKEYNLHLFYGPTMYCYIGGVRNAAMSVILLDENTLQFNNYDGSSTIFKRD